VQDGVEVLHRTPVECELPPVLFCLVLEARIVSCTQ
jgi:hypothetical protein